MLVVRKKCYNGQIFELHSEELNAYAQDEVYGYVLKDEDGNEESACWGFIRTQSWDEFMGEMEVETGCSVHDCQYGDIDED